MSTHRPTRRPARRRSRLRAALLLPLLAVIALLAGCASHSDNPAPATSGSSGAAAAPAFPVTLTVPGGAPLTLNAQPQHIVSLSPTSTETLFALGAGKQVVAVDDQSSYPAEAPKTKLSALNPNAEAIAGYKPDLVVASGDTGKLTENLSKVHIPVLVLAAPNTLQDALDQMTLLGKATGHTQEATKLVTDTQGRIKSIVDGTTKPATPLSFYYELDQTFYSVTSKTFIGQVFAQFGMTNIADKAPEAGGYPQLSAEAVSAANPDLVFLADTKCCGQNAQVVAKRPGWSKLKAVRNGNVVELDDDIASRWGPRLVDLVQAVGTAVDKAAKQETR
ncbi:ABC transporter substrate-binding protein [Labedaea rhizosphaerae]|uniref:Iron complex transport system substrate-binding protein n=1 Tax=Labedaea rhizosphaerae TaxID=598644 RepID=A0A4R6SDH4_LABRH|nr:ABC transporter substrate-binding protein [Labedaea rhizosphaerae]TDP97135.1 iron complex transport system substrate-binding protein [Labedaea rhizosphaerae]